MVSPRWTPERGGWTEAEVKLLRGRMTDAEVASRIGRTENAVRSKRRRVERRAELLAHLESTSDMTALLLQ